MMLGRRLVWADGDGWRARNLRLASTCPVRAPSDNSWLLSTPDLGRRRSSCGATTRVLAQGAEWASTTTVRTRRVLKLRVLRTPYEVNRVPLAVSPKHDRLAGLSWSRRRRSGLRGVTTARVGRTRTPYSPGSGPRYLEEESVVVRRRRPSTDGRGRQCEQWAAEN